eukprot:TRINITY_DN43762_c0_g1_i3.p1 TRINITY_DN43762_c0_g1~~TRINITY_DN43762_c0_g1_i3.p1  ORF type:complete len:268 (-),score=53.46 TRINITY_DN43762_c0_g1_i3:158-961(-)
MCIRDRFSADDHDSLEEARAARREHLEEAHNVYEESSDESDDDLWDDELYGESDEDYDWDGDGGMFEHPLFSSHWEGDFGPPPISWDGAEKGELLQHPELLAMLQQLRDEHQLPPEVVRMFGQSVEEEIYQRYQRVRESTGVVICDTCGAEFWEDAYSNPRAAATACQQHRRDAHGHRNQTEPAEPVIQSGDEPGCRFCNRVFPTFEYVSAGAALGARNNHERAVHREQFQVHDGVVGLGSGTRVVKDSEVYAVSYTHLTLPTKRIV